MQRHDPVPYPPPDVHPAWAYSPAPGTTLLPASAPTKTQAPSPASNPDFLIVGLFALRLARRLVLSLEYYPERVDDIRWLENFLDTYPSSYDLAKITSSWKQTYVKEYPQIVSRMKRQKRYPMCFMALNPMTLGCREVLQKSGGTTDG